MILLKKQQKMDDLQKLSYSTLIDLLSKKTSEYTRMLKNGITTEEYTSCKIMIEQLTKEINARKQIGEHISKR